MITNSLESRYMEFLLGDQLFAMPLMTVKEVIQKPDITTVPNMPAQFEGMMNLRGQILGVFDVRKKLGVKSKDKNRTTPEVVIVIEHSGISVGMIVDEVTKVLHPTPDMIKSAPVKEDDSAAKFIKSVIQSGNEMVLTIDVNQLLEIEKYRSKEAA